METSSEEARQAAIREFIQQHYADAHRISVDVSATGQGHHLRWHYSEDLIAPEEEEDIKPRDLSPTLSQVSTAFVDDDGDSMMFDEEDDERARTPNRFSPFDPGSVILTPRKDKWRILRREPRIGGGFDWWHEQEGVEDRVTYVRKTSVAPQDPCDPAQLGPDARQLFALVEAQRERYGHPGPSRHKTRTPSPDDDDDALSEASVATVATVIVDPRNPTQPTLFNGELPIVRQPANVQNPSGGRLGGHLSTIEEEGSVGGRGVNTQAPPRATDFAHVRIFRDNAGNWVREGSLGPEAVYHIDRSLLPPRVDQGPAGGSGRPEAIIQRTDTEPVIFDEPAKPRKKVRLVPVVEITTRPKRLAPAKETTEAKAEPARTPVRRSARLNKQNA